MRNGEELRRTMVLLGDAQQHREDPTRTVAVTLTEAEVATLVAAAQLMVVTFEANLKHLSSLEVTAVLDAVQAKRKLEEAWDTAGRGGQ